LRIKAREVRKELSVQRRESDGWKCKPHLQLKREVEMETGKQN